ncbi:hypothetical protein AAZX31_13G265700 [Glycine max]
MYHPLEPFLYLAFCRTVERNFLKNIYIKIKMMYKNIEFILIFKKNSHIFFFSNNRTRPYARFCTKQTKPSQSLQIGKKGEEETTYNYVTNYEMLTMHSGHSAIII